MSMAQDLMTWSENFKTTKNMFHHLHEASNKLYYSLVSNISEFPIIRTGIETNGKWPIIRYSNKNTECLHMPNNDML